VEEEPKGTNEKLKLMKHTKKQAIQRTRNLFVSHTAIIKKDTKNKQKIKNKK